MHNRDLEATGEERTEDGPRVAAPEVTRMPVAHGSSPSSATANSSAGWLSGSDAISHGRFAPGTMLADRYRIVGLLGKGGMGEVYRADDLKLGQVVALKFPPDTLSQVMIDGRGNVRVMDFGLAVAGGAQSENIRAGTPGYMAPEQLAGREVSVRSDVYAVGLVLFEIFTGRRTFDVRTLAELVRLHDAGEITRPTDLVPGLDASIERAILRCLERAPDRRPASALAVAASLPGGDPLAAALAAGETPSPAMVAAAGHEHALSPRVAIGTLASIALVLLALPLIADQRLLLRAIPTPKPVDVLVDRAQAIRASLGYTDAPADEAHGIVNNGEYLSHIADTDQSPDRWTRLRSGRPSGMLFGYRSSPRALVRLAPGRRPALGDPPLTFSGMTNITTDTQGRLLQFDAVAPQRETDAAAIAPAEPDWRVLFNAADLPMESFTRTNPTWTPRTFADVRAAWEGPSPGDPQTRLRIEAAAYRGRPVFLQIINPWTRAARMEAPRTGGMDLIMSVLASLAFFAIVAGAAAPIAEALIASFSSFSS